MAKRKVRVMCTYFVEVELDEEEYERRHFIIEDNGCPGTGLVYHETANIIEECDEAGICWACKMGGQNRIVDPSGECRYVNSNGR